MEASLVRINKKNEFECQIFNKVLFGKYKLLQAFSMPKIFTDSFFGLIENEFEIIPVNLN